jgi:hypothetical protein
MRTKLIGLAMLIALSVADTASAEINYPWCRQAADGSVSCSFSSQQQCQDASVGKGGFCLQNPRYQAPAGPPSGKRKNRAS